MRRWIIGLVLGLGLACGGGEAEVPDEEAPPELELPELRDTGILPPEADPPPRRERGGDDGRKGRERGDKGGGSKGGTKCLSVAGRDVDADVRLVFEGRTLVGGSLSYVDRSTGTSGIVEPLKGSRKGDVLTASGPAFDDKGKRKGEVEVLVARQDKGLALSIDGEQVMGKVKVGRCEGDL